MKTKYCPRCNRVLPKTNFARNCHTDDGLQIHCRECGRWHAIEAMYSPRVLLGLACGLQGNRQSDFPWHRVLPALREVYGVQV